MEYVNVSHKRLFKGIIHNFSSELDGENAVNNLLSEEGYWSTKQRDVPVPEFFIIDYQDIVTINHIELIPSGSGSSTFPGNFRIEISADGNTWRVFHTEKNFKLETETYKLQFPLTDIRFLKVIITDPKEITLRYYTEIGQCIAGISGIGEIAATSSSSSESGPEKLLDYDDSSCWETQIKRNSEKESLFIDLGDIFHINRIVLATSPMGFPENILFECSTDNEIWEPLLEEKNFYKGEPKKRYSWDFTITPIRFLRIEADAIERAPGEFVVRIAELEICAAVFDHSHTHNTGRMTPFASIFQAGLVKLAKDGDSSAGTVVQGSDRRLWDATTLFKGIVQLAEDGEDHKGTVVQASDSRLKPASELKPGIVRLGYDREIKPGTAVQGNDSRLQTATVDSFGITRLCPDGKYTDLGVVTGNDSRLQKATEKFYGICQLAGDGDYSQGKVIQASDNRLRDASTTYKGIIMLAEDGTGGEGTVVQANDKRLQNASSTSKGIVELAEDGEDLPGVVVQGSDQRLKEATTTSKGIVELAEDGEEKHGAVVQGNDRRLKDATVSTKGIVELAENGEDRAGVVVQGHDKRLKDASEVGKGILRFAADGEEADLAAVQGNDKRLKEATTGSKGIAELAEDGEDNEGVVVQGHDRRLKDATTTTKGIVELAEDGEEKPGIAVQGNDRRLKEASELEKGILRFAADAESTAFAAVQGNDRRLKDATTTTKGIVELAEDGENAEGVAVQGNDKRLKDATTISRGIVELAEDGEESDGVAVQGNDRRLKPATERSPGIVRLGKENETKANFVVQANDPRLSNDRNPLPHSHEYAPEEHDFNSHKGSISVKGARDNTFKELTPPSDESSIIHAVNESVKPGAIGIAGVAGTKTEKASQSYGVVGHSRYVGVRGQSSGGESPRGCGVLGISRFGAGGVFSSEHTYALVADGYGKIAEYDDSFRLMGNGDALQVSGKADFNGPLHIRNDHQAKEDHNFPVNIVELFEVDEKEYISPGNMLIAAESGGSVLSLAQDAYTRSVIGIVAGNPTVILNNCGTEKKVYPVVLAGKALCKVDARETPIHPGDLIVTSNTRGCGMKGTIDSFDKVGTVIGKALDRLEEGIGLIPVFITHQ
ncbi:MAG: hypothetical protein GY754_04865 [bacterium]|nr:hypothetical protein [bacterium]